MWSTTLSSWCSNGRNRDEPRRLEQGASWAGAGMMPAAKLSVIIPAFNAGETLGRCLAALKAQPESEECEIIVVDDASSDETPAIARAAGVICLRQETNRGAAAARNLGAKAAGAELLLFVDADVALTEKSLGRVMEFFSRRPEIAAGVGSYTPRPGRSDFGSLYHNLFTYYHHDLSGAEVEWFWGAIGAVRREAFTAVGGFDERYAGAAAEDIQFGFELSRLGRRIAYLREVQGEHLHRFSLRRLLWNDYRKAVLWIKLSVTRRHRHGFSNPANAVGLAAAGLFAPSLAGWCLGGAWALAPLLCLAVFVLAGGRFYKFLAREMGLGFALRAVPLHFLSFLVIAAGTGMGLVGLALGRPLQSKSPWL